MTPSQQDTIARLQEAVEAGPTDEQLRAILAVQWPALYRDSLRSEHDWPRYAAENERRIEVARKQYEAIANPTAIRSLLDLLREQESQLAAMKADAERYRLVRAGYCVLELLTPEARPEEGLNYRNATLKAKLKYGNPEEGAALDAFIDRAQAALTPEGR